MLYEKAYCINLKRRPERKALSESEFDRIGISVTFVDAVDGSVFDMNEHRLLGGYQALNKTIIGIIEDAMFNNYKSIRIIEDDVIFSEDYLEIYNRNKDNIPDDFSVLYFGCKTPLGTQNVVKNIERVMFASLGHDFIISNTIFKDYKSKLELMDSPSDVCLREIYSNTFDEDNNFKYKAYCIKPDISGQRSGYSDNIHMKVPRKCILNDRL